MWCGNNYMYGTFPRYFISQHSFWLSIPPPPLPTKIWHILPCPLYNIYSSRWILPLFNINDHQHERMCRAQWPLTLTYILKVIQSLSCDVAYCMDYIHLWHKYNTWAATISRSVGKGQCHTGHSNFCSWGEGYPNVSRSRSTISSHDDVIKRKRFPLSWPFVRAVHRSSVNPPHKGQWHGTFVFS